MENTLTPQITSYDDVVNTVNKYSNDLSGMFRHALKAQLAVLDYIQKPVLINTCIDTVLENLHYSLEIAVTETEEKMVRRQSALLIQSLLFTVHATILQKNKETREEGIKLLKIATENIATFSADIALTVGTLGGSKNAAIVSNSMNVIADFLNKKSLENDQEVKKNGFINRIVDYFASSFENKENENQYYALLDNVFEKIARNKGLLGKSIILSELIRNHSDQIIDYALEDAYDQLSNITIEYNSIQTPFFQTGYIFLYPVLLFILFFTWIVDFFANTDFIASTYMGYWLLFPIPIFGFKLVRNHFEKQSLKNVIAESEAGITQKQQALKQKYDDIAAALYPVY